MSVYILAFGEGGIDGVEWHGEPITSVDAALSRANEWLRQDPVSTVVTVFRVVMELDVADGSVHVRHRIVPHRTVYVEERTPNGSVVASVGSVEEMGCRAKVGGGS